MTWSHLKLDDGLYDAVESVQPCNGTLDTLDIHIQFRFRLYSSRRTNYLGRVGKLALHNSTVVRILIRHKAKLSAVLGLETMPRVQSFL